MKNYRLLFLSLILGQIAFGGDLGPESARMEVELYGNGGLGRKVVYLPEDRDVSNFTYKELRDLASKAYGQPVRIFFDREEDLSESGDVLGGRIYDENLVVFPVDYGTRAQPKEQLSKEHLVVALSRFDSSVRNLRSAILSFGDDLELQATTLEALANENEVNASFYLS